MQEFRNSEDVGRWLQNRSREHAVVIAVRAALRVAPLLVASIGGPDDVEKSSREIIIPAFRGLAASWFDSVFPQYHSRLDPVYKAASFAAGAAAAKAAVAAAAYSADAAYRSVRASAADDLSSAGIEAANATAAAAASAAYAAQVTTASASLLSTGDATQEKTVSASPLSAGDAAYRLIYAAISSDADFLEVNPDVVDREERVLTLARHQLWINDLPDWASSTWATLEATLLRYDQNWKVWTDWYRNRLVGNTTDESSTISLIAIGEDIWSGTSTEINSKIKRLMESDNRFETFKRQPVESVEPQSDEPTSSDLLGRRSFAQALVERMDKLYLKGGQDGFAIHVYGPWGVGKTSVLRMMRELMIAEDRKAADGNSAESWVVVSFNAWQHQYRNPPWWPLMQATKAECLRSLWNVNMRAAAWLWLRWVSWKIRTDALPYIVFILVGAASIFFIRYTSGSAGGTNLYEWSLKVFAAAVTACAAFLAASRIAVFGSVENAKYYENISQDPLKRITHLFAAIIDKTKKPVCVLVDDLDRCRAEYVVDLLEGIQTCFRHKSVAYVVAADRNWIKASFESHYGTFSNSVGNIGQPLGYLFMEKLFQVSTPVPGMGDKRRNEYWSWLLKGGDPPAGAAKGFNLAVEREREGLRQKHGQNLTREQADAILNENDRAEVRAAILLELNRSDAAEKEAEHLLTQFVDIVPDNPRVMKRMVNAFAMRQAIGILEKSKTPAGVLARWMILEQRFPALADLLVEHPEWIRTLALEGCEKSGVNIPPLLLPFIDSVAVREIIGDVDGDGLNTSDVRTITKGSAV